MDYLEYEVEHLQRILDDPRNNPFDSYWGTLQRCFGAASLFALMNEGDFEQIEDIYNETAEKIKEIYFHKFS
jgi:hypothetical protein